MNNSVSVLTSSKFDNINTSLSFKKRINTKKSKPKQDEFTKTGAKTVKNTIKGSIFGAILGVLKEKIKPTPIADSIVEKYDISNLKPDSKTILGKMTEIIDEDVPVLKSAANKLLNGVELTKEEANFLNNSKIILPEDVKFLANGQTPFREFLQEVILSSEENARTYINNAHAHFHSSGLMGGANTWLSTMDRINDFLNDGVKYNDNEEFLDYMNSRIYKGKKYKIETTKNGEINYILFDKTKDFIKEGSVLSDETYTYKQMLYHAKENGKTHWSSVISEATNKITPVKEYMVNVKQQALKNIENEFIQTKNTAINNFQNKQFLKSAKAGAVIVGAIFFVETLFYNIAKKLNK